MKLSQLIYTNCANAGQMPNGYVIYGKSPDITEEEARFIQRVLDYSTRPEMAYDAPPEVIEKTFPRKYGVFTLPSGRLCFGQATYIGLDSGGNRYGNYIIHAFVTEKGQGIDPYSFYGSEAFRRCLSKEEMMGPIKGELPPIEVPSPRPLQGNIHVQDEDLLIRLLVFLRKKKYAPEDKIYLRMKQEDYPAFLGLLSRHVVGNGAPVSLLTYLNGRYDGRPGINLLFETEPLSGVENAVVGMFDVYYFDLLEGKSNVDVQVDPFFHQWASLLLKDEAKAIEMMRGIEETKARYGILSDEEAYDLLRLLQGRFEDLGGVLPSIALYEKHLRGKNPNGLADKLYLALSEREKADTGTVNRLYADLSDGLRKDIGRAFLRSVLASPSSYEEGIAAIENPPLGTPRGVLELLFSNPTLGEYENLNDRSRLILLVLSKNFSGGEELALRIAGKMSDKRAILKAYEKHLPNAGYAKLARYLYAELSKSGGGLDDYKALYAYLDPKVQEAIVLDYFSGIVEQELPYPEACRRLFEANPFLGKEQALRLFMALFYPKLPDYEDYGKLLAIRLSPYGQATREEVLRLYGSLERRGVGEESTVFSLASEMAQNGLGEAILSVYVQENADSYRTEAEILHLLERLAAYPSLQSSFFLRASERGAIGIVRALELVKRFPMLSGSRIDFLKELSAKRADPFEAETLCKKHPEEPFGKQYMDTLFAKDRSAMLGGATGIASNLRIIDQHDLSPVEFKHCLEKIYGSPFKDLVAHLPEKRHLALKKQGREKGIELGKIRGLVDYDVFLCFCRGASGNLVSLEACGFPEKDVFAAYRVHVDENYAEVVGDKVLAILAKHPKQLLIMHTAVKPLLVSEKVRNKLSSIGNRDMIVLMIRYVKQYGDEDELSAFYKPLIGRYFSKHKSEIEDFMKEEKLSEEEVKAFIAEGRKGKLHPALVALMVIVFPIGIVYLATRPRKKK